MRSRSNPIDLERLLESYLKQHNVQEFGFLSIARQGGRVALEVLASAAVREGKHVYVGVNLAGPRAMAPNVQTIRFAETPRIPAGNIPIYPRGLMVMHESLLEPAREPTIGSQLGTVREAVASLTSGTLMVCTSKQPQSVEFPLDFEGTVATVDAESIFQDVVGISPAAFGITALGLFAAATNPVGFQSIRAAALEFGCRFSPRIRDANVRALELAYESARIWSGARIKGKLGRAEYLSGIDQTTQTLAGASQGNVAFAWRDSLPVCDQTMCTCAECVVAYYCPEGVVAWKDGAYKVDYEFCKGCGVCAFECPNKAIEMVRVTEVLKSDKRVPPLAEGWQTR